MSAMRAKMRLDSVMPYPETGQATQETLQFRAVGANSYPADGSSEDNTYARFTPMAELRMTVANPALLGKFREGQVFYVDFTEAAA